MSKPREHYFASFSFRLFGNFLATAIMCAILSLIALFFVNIPWVLLVVQLCCCGMVYTLVYSTAWEVGSKDNNRVSYGHLKEDLGRGLKAALLASSPWIASSLGLVLMKAGLLPYGFLAFYRMLNSPYMAINQIVLSTNATVGEFSWVNILLSAALPLIAPVVAGFGYALGYRGTAVMRVLMYRRKED